MYQNNLKTQKKIILSKKSNTIKFLFYFQPKKTKDITISVIKYIINNHI
jgi:hypothetical protein